MHGERQTFQENGSTKGIGITVSMRTSRNVSRTTKRRRTFDHVLIEQARLCMDALRFPLAMYRKEN